MRLASHSGERLVSVDDKTRDGEEVRRRDVVIGRRIIEDIRKDKISRGIGR